MLLATLLAWLGFAWLALSQERHRERVGGPPAASTRVPWVRRAMGFISVALALPLCIASQGASFGSLLWVTLLSAAAMAVALTLTWRPRWLKWLA